MDWSSLKGHELLALDLMFVPGGGSRGAGEYNRSLVLAKAVRERWLEARIAFLADEEHPRFEHDIF